jgi:hypothetical protein
MQKKSEPNALVDYLDSLFSILQMSFEDTQFTPSY